MKQILIILAILILSCTRVFSQECATIKNGRVKTELPESIEKKDAIKNIGSQRILSFTPDIRGTVTVELNNKIVHSQDLDPNSHTDLLIKLHSKINKLTVSIEGPQGCMIAADLLTDYKIIEFTKQDAWTITYAEEVKKIK